MDDLTLAQRAKIAIKAAGGASEVARKITAIENREPPLTPQAVQKWGKSKVPSERVLLLEKFQNAVTRFDIRPDLYPQEQKTPSVT